ncbi:MAG: Exodeoxyribonuclease VII large subunit [uncultured Acetobacteraceae bacterium]|uniref:Exodeoxyribonuclease 7 large subunit n=1 Tax=uncultured Acetobacteraceae bacterium TaxID=169975 RepID=A0A6J4JE44_9PROT|nr:MAG: Exodeoxyribonuclease VII large subunit [uncultured Acetobacteraceae bacterium]
MDMPLPRDVPAADNVPDYAVSEIAGAIKRTLKETFGRVRVRGEITEFKRYPSGHVYLSLKDESAKLEAVVWKTNVPRLAIRPENGVEVIATGRIDTYADRSKYQLVIDRLDYAGEGALLARIERLRLRLLEEGLFAPERKRAIPMLPRVIGVVTSERGAVIQDIRTTVARRFPRRILLWPVAVQGAGAAEGIAAAIEGFGALPLDGPVPRPDVLIVARGGGSLEDLMAFNEEVVVRAAAACPIPLISAVGHETDTTLIDFASDRRAPTPTAAAEMAVPHRADLLADVAQHEARLRHGLRAVLERSRRHLMVAERGLPDLPGILGGLRQRMEDRAERLELALPVLVDRKRGALGRLAPRLPHPREGIANRRAALAALFGRSEVGAQRVLARGRTSKALVCFSPAPVRALLRENAVRLEGSGARLGGVSYQAVLARGFAFVQDAEGATLTAAADVPAGARLVLTFADGQVGTTADGAKPGGGRRRDGRDPSVQGALL